MDKKYWIYILLIFLIVWGGAKSFYTNSEKGFKGRIIPFTSLKAEEVAYEVMVDEKAERFALAVGGKPEILLPSGYIPLQIVNVGENGIFLFAREMFEKSMALFRIQDDKIQNMDLPREFNDFLFRSAVWYDNRIESSLYFVAYNVVSFKHELYRVNISEGGVFDTAFRVDLDFGANEIDENIKMIVSKPSINDNGNGQLLIFGSEVYYRVISGGPCSIDKFPLEGILYQILDNEEGQYYFCSQENNTVFVLRNINDPSDVCAERCEAGEFYMIDETGSIPKLKKVTTIQEKLMVLEKQLCGLSCGGINELGCNNYEGRIPWSAVYYWNGLIDLLMPEFDKFLATKDFVTFREKVNIRLNIEMQVFDKLLASEKGLTCRRYSVNRIDTLSVLHGARILEVYERYLKYASEPIRLKMYDKLYQLAYDFEGTEELLVMAADNDPNGVNEGEPYFLTGSNLVCDNVAAPYNYMSGWISATCVRELFHKGVKKNEYELACNLIQHLLSDPAFLDFDEEGEWPYFYGEAYKGWEETGDHQWYAVFEGQTYTAGISYRSMDAKAIIYAMTMEPKLRNEKVIQYLKECTETGKLLPFVNEALIECGIDEAEIGDDVLSQYMRIHYGWEVQNAVWAFGGMAEK